MVKAPDSESELVGAGGVGVVRQAISRVGQRKSLTPLFGPPITEQVPPPSPRLDRPGGGVGGRGIGVPPSTPYPSFAGSKILENF